MKLRKFFSFMYFLLFALSIKVSLAQTAKGFTVSKQDDQKQVGKTYALIVGISKYQDPGIPALNYADKDAEAFYNYLRASGVDENNMTLRLNESAKSGTLWMDILNLTETSVKGDRVYIYFSGHGDVESKTLLQDAYLLSYDTPKAMYVAGSVPVYQLQNYLATLSSKGVEVIFICDACRSGNLAGGREGMQAAANVLKGVWKDEIKILSCQPGELSIEGKQWGNGRGLFSYELINGIAGLADRNKDGKVILKELNLFLMEKVSDLAAPAIQNPVVSGNMESELATVNKDYLAKLASRASSSIFASIDSRGMEEALLRHQPDTIKKIYSDFIQLIGSQIFSLADFEGKTFPPERKLKNDYAAYELINLIPDNDSIKLLKGMMKRNLAAEMINEINRSIDEIVDNSNTPNLGSGFMSESNYAIPLNELLGRKKIQELGLLPKLIFREAIRWSQLDSSVASILQLLDSAMAIDDKQPYLLSYYASLLIVEGRYREALTLINRVVEISPRFIYPYRLKAGAYRNLGLPDSSILTTRIYLALDSTFALAAYRHFALSYYLLDKMDSVDYYFTKLYQTADYQKDTMKLLHSIDLLGELAIKSKRYHDAIYYNQSEINIMIARNKNEEMIRFEESRPNVSFSHTIWINMDDCYYNIAFCYSLLNEKENALLNLKKSLDAGYKNYAHIESDPDLDNIRSTPEFIALMKKYFPEQYK